MGHEAKLSLCDTADDNKILMMMMMMIYLEKHMHESITPYGPDYGTCLTPLRIRTHMYVHRIISKRSRR